MRVASLAVPALLSDAEALAARVGAGWLGMLWVTALPLRLLQVHFFERVIGLGETAGDYGNYLGELSLAIGLAWLPALWGRALYTRACASALGSGHRPGREVWRLPAGAFLNYVYLAFALELGMLATALTLLPIPIFVLLAGLAAGGWELTGPPHLLRPWRLLLEHGRRFVALLGAQLVLGLACAVVAINLFALFQLLVWLGHGTAGLDLARWQVLMSAENPSFLLLVAAGAWLLLEPFWLAVCTVYVRATRARTSGEDLRSWWAALARTLAVVPLVWLLSAAPARAETAVSPAEYRERLAAIETALRSGAWPSARERAQQLLEVRVQTGAETLATDAWVLEPVLEVSDAAQARSAAAALAVLRGALAAREGDAPGEAAGASPDRELLARLEQEQKLVEPAAGGAVELPVPEPSGFWERSLETLAETGEWLLDKLEQLRDWLRRRLKKSPETAEGTAIDTRLVVVFVVLAALALVLLALRRRRGGAAPEAVEHGEPIVSAAAGDANPLSREEDEWQQHARALEAQGRPREAVRAWYHAVLVALYRRGLLQYRKGRTNWEYVAALSPGLAWRPHFIALTRLFESEWYGRAASSGETLAHTAAEARSVLAGLQAGLQAERDAA